MVNQMLECRHASRLLTKMYKHKVVNKLMNDMCFPSSCIVV